MNGIVIKTDMSVSVREFGEPLYKSVGEAVGGFVEHVIPRYLMNPFCMMVNEEGLLRGLPVNPYGCIFYGSHIHGIPIVGDVVIMKDGMVNGERDIVGLTDDDISVIISYMTAIGFLSSETEE